MVRKQPSLENWFAVPAHAQNLDAFLDTKTGLLAIATARYEFRAAARDVAVVPNVRYGSAHKLRNAFREGAEAMLELFENMSSVKQKKERLPDEGWATRPLIREEEKEAPPATKKKK